MAFNFKLAPPLSLACPHSSRLSLSLYQCLCVRVCVCACACASSGASASFTSSTHTRVFTRVFTYSSGVAFGCSQRKVLSSLAPVLCHALTQESSLAKPVQRVGVDQQCCFCEPTDGYCSVFLDPKAVQVPGIVRETSVMCGACCIVRHIRVVRHLSHISDSISSSCLFSPFPPPCLP